MSDGEIWGVEIECHACSFVYVTDKPESPYLCRACQKERDDMEQKALSIAMPGSAVTDEALWKLIAGGDLSGLNDKQKAAYYLQLCNSLGMNPATQPFEYITLNGKLRLYAKKDATDQLRQIRGVSILGKPEVADDGDYITATVSVEDKTGRSDSDIGVVFAGNNKGEIRANLRMKALTKAKRRATLSVCGLGMLDESEVEDIPAVRSTRDTMPMLPVEAEDESQEPPNTVDDMEEALPPSRSERVGKILDAFGEFNVKIADLEKFLEQDAVKWGDEDLNSLRRIYKSLKSGETTWAAIIKIKADLQKSHALA